MTVKKVSTKKKSKSPVEEEEVRPPKNMGPIVMPPKAKPIVKAEVAVEEKPKKKPAVQKKSEEKIEEAGTSHPTSSAAAKGTATKVEAKAATAPTPPSPAKPTHHEPKKVAEPARKPKIEVHKTKESMAPASKPAPSEKSKKIEPISTPHTVSSSPRTAPTLSPSPSSEASRVASYAPASTRRKVQFNEMMTVKDLASAMDVKITDLIRKLLTMGTPATINQRLDVEVATLIANEFDCDLEVRSIFNDEKKEEVDDPANLKLRSPVVTVMGHVDHGKTSLLDAIRSAQVASGEAGGITQHIGAYQVKTPKGTITFLDTPGHEAFTAMRARGAKATDLVILVVAADDSVMPQTIEAIDHARAANVPIVVAINKVDLPVANVQRVKQELAQHNLVAEDWGGKTVMVEVSAKTKKNIDKLLEMILLETELLELKANPNRPGRGVVLEARMDQRRGITATVLIQNGTLRVGDIIVCGLTSGRVRAMFDENWNSLAEAGPSSPVALLGLLQVPQVGDSVSVVATDHEAREIAERRKNMMKEASAKPASSLSLESLHSQIEEGKIQELRVIVKADVQGSLEAIQDSLAKISGKPIQIRFVHTGVGNINDSDILLAEAANAVVFGFHVKAETSAETEAKRSGVDLRTYQIIYEMIEDVRAAMEGLLKPVDKEIVKGRALVKTVFPSSRSGRVAGCLIQEGKITRGWKARVVRAGNIVAHGTVTSLKRFKEDVRDVEKGYECGIGIDGVTEFQTGDVIEAFVIEKHAQRLTG